MRERQQAWLEAKFREKNDDESHLFIEHKFDSFFRDFSVNPNHEEEYKFSREDLKTEIKPNIDVDVSNKPSFGSEDQESDDAQSTHEHFLSSNWKRIDVREKKIIRGMCGLTKDYFRDITEGISCHEEMFNVWDECMKLHFPDLYQRSRLMILSQISVTCLGWKYTQKVNSFKNFTIAERRQIIKFGKEFRNQRNKLCTSKDRKKMLCHPLVKIGKLLFTASPKYEAAFWKHILDHKKADIENFKDFKTVHLNDIAHVQVMACVGDVIGTLH